jgi:mRNA interferase RelE/StbE
VAQVRFTDDAIADLNDLPLSSLKLVLGKLRVLRRNAEAGYVLGRRRTGNLTGFRCLVIGDRSHRAVYKVEDNGDVCVVWVISGRADDEVYEEAVSRLERLGNDPRAEALGQALGELKPPVARAVIKIRSNQPSDEQI